MEGYSEFYEENGELIVHVECYGERARHFTDYKLNKDEYEKLKSVIGTEEGSLKFLTKNYSNGIKILDLLNDNGIKGDIISKGYEDTSSDV